MERSGIEYSRMRWGGVKWRSGVKWMNGRVEWSRVMNQSRVRGVE